MSRHLSAGIDIGSHTTRVCIAEAGSKSSGFSVIGTGCAESHGVRHGYIINEEEAARSVRKAVTRAEKQSGVTIKRAPISVGGVGLESETTTGSILISRIDGEVTDADVARVLEACEENIKLSNKKIIHRIPLGFKLDNKEVLGRPTGMRGIKLEARTVFITVLAQHLEDLMHTVERAGIEVDDVVAAPVAASLVSLTKAQRTAGCVLANIGAETVFIAVFENDHLLSLEVFPIGSTDITNDIALGLKIPLEEAEEIKVNTRNAGGTEYPQKKLDEIVEARLNDIFELIENHLKKIGKNELLPAGIILTGGGAGMTTIEDIAKAALKLPARVVVPYSFVDMQNEPLQTAWAVAYGLCVLGFEPSYQSDLLRSPHLRFRGFGRVALNWLRQFYP